MFSCDQKVQSGVISGAC